MKPDRPRVLWLAGTRSDVLRLGPYALHFQSVDAPRERVNWFALTGEQGMAACQAIDDCGLRPDAEVELRHPAEDPTVRLQGLMEDVETLARRYRATHVVFSGCGPTAAAAALVCHGRELHGVWLKPHDPAGLIARLRWERGLSALIGSLGECVQPLETAAAGAIGSAPSGDEAGEEPMGRRRGHPLAIVAVTRPAWGLTDLPERLVASLAEWARSAPELDLLFMRSLDARFEGPLKSMGDLPPNLLTAPPVPYRVYSSWLGQAGRVVTDSWAIAAEAMGRGIRVIAMGESPRMGGEPPHPAPGAVVDVMAGDIGNGFWRALPGTIELPRQASPPTGFWSFDAGLRDRLSNALAPSA